MNSRVTRGALPHRGVLVKNRFRTAVISTLLAVAGLMTAPGIATAAAVVVPPGGSGNTCSGYSYVTGHAGWYWQTCAWANSQKIWFTVNLGNSSDEVWVVDKIWVDFIRSSVDETCALGIWDDAHENTVIVDDHSTRSTGSTRCYINRTPGAYASKGQVWEGSYHVELHSPTLQVT
jgi:hypothetical protein